MKNIFVPLASALLLAACGGSGSGANTGNAGADMLVSNAENVYNTLDNLDDNEGFTPFTAVGVETGTSTYSGVAIYAAGTEVGGTEVIDYAAIGSFEAVADFGPAQSVTGTADNFFEIANPELGNDENADLADIQVAGPIAGSFTFDLEIMELVGTAIADGTVNGSLTRSDNSQDTFTDVEAFGDFYGNDLDGIEVTAGTTDGDNFSGLNAAGLR